MTNLPTCANCHSFSRDGKTFGLDLDGPRNDKGLYALVPVSKQYDNSATRTFFHWSSLDLNDEAFRAADPAVKRFGFMSQSFRPNGTLCGHVDRSAKQHQQQASRARNRGFASGILDRSHSTNYRSIQFSQVFYPTRGILAWY